MACDGVQIVLITKGHYVRVPLEGLAVSQFVQLPPSISACLSHSAIGISIKFTLTKRPLKKNARR
jgi:hypothetical protein